MIFLDILSSVIDFLSQRLFFSIQQDADHDHDHEGVFKDPYIPP
jgi:hypothetical protein